MIRHHVVGEDVLVVSREFQMAMPGIAHQDVGVPGVSGDLQQAINGNVAFRDVQISHRVVRFKSFEIATS